MPSPDAMAARAPARLMRGQCKPSKSTGKKVEPANEKAQATQNKMSTGRWVAIQAAIRATSINKTLESMTRRTGDA